MEEVQEEKKESIREQIEWYLDRISDDKLLRKILAVINRLFVGGKIAIITNKMRSV